MRKRVDVSLLHHVFSFLFVPDDRPRRAVDPLVVAPHQQFERCCIPVHDPLNEDLIWLFANLGRRRELCHTHVLLPVYGVSSREKVTWVRVSRLPPLRLQRTGGNVTWTLDWIHPGLCCASGSA